MRRHPTDFISLLAGAVFVALGGLFTLDQLGATTFDVRWIPAILLLALGAGGIAAGIAGARSSQR